MYFVILWKLVILIALSLELDQRPQYFLKLHFHSYFPASWQVGRATHLVLSSRLLVSEASVTW